MTKEEFKVKFIEMFTKLVKVNLEKGITFDVSELTKEVWKMFKVEVQYGL